MKEKLKQKQGITLIALVITIIVLLILAGISIASLTGESGILNMARKAKEQTEQAEIKEQEDFNEINDYINNNTGNNETSKVDRSNLKIGDYVEYKPITEDFTRILLDTEVTGYPESQVVVATNPEWQILSINDDGTVDLTANIANGNTFVGFNGAVGYNNVVYLLNDICNQLFKNEELGISARSMNLNDIVKQLNQEGMEIIYKNPYGLEYGSTLTLDNAYYPNLYAKENGSGINTTETKKDGIGQSESYYTEATTEGGTQAEKLTITQTVNFGTIMSEEYFKNSNAFSLIFDRNYNVLATRGVSYFENWDTVEFGVITLNGLSMSREALYYVTGDENDGGGGGQIKPVVTIGANIEIGNGEGTKDNKHKLIIEE